MAFVFEKYKRKLELDDWDFQKKKFAKKINWTAVKKSKIRSNKFKFFSVFEKEPNDKELQLFVQDVMKLKNKEVVDEALIIAPKCDRYALSKFIEKTGILNRGGLKKVISFRACDAKIDVPKKVRKQIIEEEIKKPEIVKKMVKSTEDFKVFRKLCNYAKNFEITPIMKSKEMNIEQNFWTYLNAKFGKKEEILYEKPKGTGRLDIFLPKRKIGVEFKLIKGKADLDRVVGQILRYQEEYNFMCVVLVNIKGYPAAETKKSIKIMKSLGNVDVIMR